MKTLTSAKFAVDFYELTKDRHEDPEKYRGWSYGLDSLTKALGGIRRNQFILIGGAQKSGKSSIGLNIAAALGKQNVSFLWISLEMKHETMGAALFSNIANIERNRFRDIELDDGDWEGLRHAVGVVSKWPGFWNYGATTVRSVQALWYKVYRQFGVLPEVVLVDYVQLMEDDPNSRLSRTQQIGKISREFKLWTNGTVRPRDELLTKEELDDPNTISLPDDFEVTVIAMAQLNRESIRKGLVDANAFLDSGQLERDMDVGIIIESVKDTKTDKPHPNKRRMKIVGAREAAEDSILVWVDYTHARVVDIAPMMELDINTVALEHMSKPLRGE